MKALSFVLVLGIDYYNEFGSQYGKDWVVMRDTYGELHRIDIDDWYSSEITVAPRIDLSTIYGDVYFYLNTRENSMHSEELYMESDENDEEKIDSIYFNRENDVKLITHGWMSNANATVVSSIKDAYLRHADFNIISVDWQEISNNLLYPWAAFKTRFVGERVSQMIENLVKRYKISGKQIHLIGHSLGAHVMGYAGAYSKENISRITGLDPARPFFEVPYVGPASSLDTSDADFVDVIHTCGGVLGCMSAIGHADFYPNNGRAMQPGCEGMQPALEACSHGRAFELFAESIESEMGFKSYPCEDWKRYAEGECTTDAVLMGDPVPHSARGSYFLFTNSRRSFAMHGTERN